MLLRLIAMTLTVTAASSAGSLVLADTPPPAVEKARLTPYRAVYDLTLAQAKGNGAPTSASGRIAIDFSGSSCQGYAENFHQITELHPAEGPPTRSDLRSATFEAGDGERFNFKILSISDQTQPENVDGKARKTAGAPLSIDLASPKQRRVDFSGDVLFPAEHLRRILAAARSNEKIFEAKVFDGSDEGDKILDTTTVIGNAAIGGLREKAAQIEPLANMPRWPVSISYFEHGKTDEPPLYVMSFELFENGVSRALKLDYGEFALAGEMKELALLPASADCQQ